MEGRVTTSPLIFLLIVSVIVGVSTYPGGRAAANLARREHSGYCCFKYWLKVTADMVSLTLTIPASSDTAPP